MLLSGRRPTRSGGAKRCGGEPCGGWHYLLVVALPTPSLPSLRDARPLDGDPASCEPFFTPCGPMSSLPPFHPPPPTTTTAWDVAWGFPLPQTTDEITRFTVSEDLSDDQRLVHLLRKGTAVQQTSAASMLWQALAVGGVGTPDRPAAIVLDAVVVRCPTCCATFRQPLGCTCVVSPSESPRPPPPAHHRPHLHG